MFNFMLNWPPPIQKVIRLYANVSIHPEAGRSIAVNEAVIRPLIAVLGDCRYDVQRSAKRRAPGCVNAAGKARQKW